MAYLKPKKIHGRTYWYIAESRRVGGHVKTVNLAYLGRADDLLKRLQQGTAPHDRLKSFEHGGVAALLSLADQLDLVGLIDAHAAPPAHGQPARHLLSVGQTLVLAAVGRALHPTSKAQWADWAKKTTVGKLWGFDTTKVTSQFFWDQMDRLPVEALSAVQAELGRRVVDRFGLAADALFYDVTNFYTFIDSRNDRCDLPQRGKNKQKRNDLRQFQVGMLVSRDGWVPLLAKLYRGNHNDVTTFPRALEAIGQQCHELGIRPEHVTLVADKGNLSKSNWQLLDASQIGHVVSVVPSHHKDWAYRPAGEFVPCEIPDVGPLDLLRGQAVVAGRERTVVVLDSPTLRDGQMRGLQQQFGRVLFGLTNLQETLARAKRRRRRQAIERRIERILRNVPTVRKILACELAERTGCPGYWDFDWRVDREALAYLRDRTFGRRVLATDRHKWSSGEIVWAYWGQSEAELVFRQMKDPHFLALRPQHHWTDQKIEVHSFCCVVGYLLAALLRRHARRLGYPEGLPKLLEMLSGVRAVLRSEQRRRPGRPRIGWQLEEAEPRALRLYRSLIDPGYQVGPTPPKA